MRRIYFLIFLLIQANVLLAQKDVNYIKLKDLKPSQSFDFYFSEVIDHRADTSIIGLTTKGISTKKKPTKVEGGLASNLQRISNSYIPAGKEKSELVLIIHVLNVSQYSTNSETRFGVLEIEIAERQDSTLLSVGIFESIVDGGAIENATRKIILKCFENCIQSFASTNWRATHSLIIDLDTEKYSYGYNFIPAAGAYLSFGQLARNMPMVDIELEMYAADQSKFPKYRFELKKGEHRDDIRYISFNDSIYIYAGHVLDEPTYIKSKQLGRYMYFEMRYSDPSSGLYFGIIGTIASTKGRGIYFDTETGALKELTDYEIYQLTGKDHPEILKEYRRSKRKTDDLEDIIFKINQKYIDLEE